MYLLNFDSYFLKSGCVLMVKKVCYEILPLKSCVKIIDFLKKKYVI